MDASTLIGLGLAAWGLLSNRKQKELFTGLQDAKEELAKKDVVLEDTQKELQEFYDKQRDEAGDNWFNDLEITPILYMDFLGGQYLWCLDLIVENHSSTAEYKLKDFYATLEVFGVSANSMYAYNSDTLFVSPKSTKLFEFIAFSSGNYYGSYMNPNVYSRKRMLDFDRHLFLYDKRKPQLRTKFQQEFSYWLNRFKPTHLFDDDESSLVICGYNNALTLRELSFSVRGLNQEWNDFTINNIPGFVFVYILKNNEKSINTPQKILSGDIKFGLNNFGIVEDDFTVQLSRKARKTHFGLQFPRAFSLDKNKQPLYYPFGWVYKYDPSSGDFNIKIPGDSFRYVFKRGENKIKEKDA